MNYSFHPAAEAEFLENQLVITSQKFRDWVVPS